MSSKNRETLKNYFAEGQLPTEAHFADLIDSMLNMTDEAGGDDKLLCVAAGDVRKSYLQDLNDVPAYELSEIKHFFEVYKTLEPGKSVQGGEWVGHDEAEKEINASYTRFKDSH